MPVLIRKHPCPRRIKLRITGAEIEMSTKFAGAPFLNETDAVVWQNALVEYRECIARYALPLGVRNGRWRGGSTSARAILLNQGQCYRDGALVEYATPEGYPKQSALYETAGLEIMSQALKEFNRECGVKKSWPVTAKMYKSNRNTKLSRDGNLLSLESFGSHGNYITFRSVPYADMVTYLVPFLKTRWCMIGNGWIDFFGGEFVHFLLSQRADVMADAGDIIQGEEMTNSRTLPHIHLFAHQKNEEPLADEHVWKRVHDMSENSNMSQKQLWLKRGAMDIVLAMVEAGNFLKPPPRFSRKFNGNETSKFFNADIRSCTQFPLEGGGTTSAVDVQRFYIDEAVRFFKEGRGTLTDERKEALDLWIATIDAIARWDVPHLARYLDWAAILNCASGLFERINLDMEEFIGVVRGDTGFAYPMLHPIAANVSVPRKRGEARLLDYLLQFIVEYANIETEKSPYGILMKRGAMDALFSPEEIAGACLSPPVNTRANLREELEQTLSSQTIVATSWSEQYVRCSGDAPDAPLRRISMQNPWRSRIGRNEKWFLCRLFLKK